MIAPEVNSALAHADVCIVHNDWPHGRDLTAADFEAMRRKVLVDGRQILHREAVQGIELTVLRG
jgi:UDP-glucose 6-dehydrogenase